MKVVDKGGIIGVFDSWRLLVDWRKEEAKTMNCARTRLLLRRKV